MNTKKTTVNISSDNYIKVQKISQETGLTQTEIINAAIADMPIIVLGNQKNIAESFFEIKKLLAKNDTTNIKKEVNVVCQSLNLLMQKLEEVMHLKEV